MTEHALHLPSLSPEDPRTEPLIRAVLGTAMSGGPVTGLGVLSCQDALTEVAQWAARGQAADESAAVWLGGLRWARCVGLRPDDDAPVPPLSWWEEPGRRWAEGSPVSAREQLGPEVSAALTGGQMPYPARPVTTAALGPQALLRLTPLIWHAPEDPVHLGQLAVNLTALLSGEPEGLACSMLWVLLLRRILHDAAPLASALADLRDLLLPQAPAPAAPAGLMARMRATGGTVEALRALLRSAPASAALLASGPKFEEHEEAPAIVRALAAALADGAADVPEDGAEDGPEEAGAAEDSVNPARPGEAETPEEVQAMRRILEMVREAGRGGVVEREPEHQEAQGEEAEDPAAALAAGAARRWREAHRP